MLKQDWIEITGILFCIGLFLVANSAMEDQRPAEGDWELTNHGGDTARLVLKHRSMASRWSWSSDQPVADLHGLSLDQLRSLSSDVKFTLDREPGQFAFEGKAIAGFARGHYRFIANPAFTTQLHDLGFGPASDADVFDLAMRGMTVGFARDVKASGLSAPSVHDLVQMLDHGVTREYLADMAAAGYNGLSVEELVRMKDHGVTPAFVRAVKNAGYGELSAEELVRMKDHGVDAAYMQKLAASGFRELTAEQVMKLKDHGVD